jgi:hypothetical protein
VGFRGALGLTSLTGEFWICSGEDIVEDMVADILIQLEVGKFIDQKIKKKTFNFILLSKIGFPKY